MRWYGFETTRLDLVAYCYPFNEHSRRCLTSLTSNMKEGLRSANSSTTSVTGLTIRSETGPDFSRHSGVKQQTAVRGHSVGGGFSILF
ncbi:hypothetical protein CLOSTMETH_01966 [[Clostridium] methylpentosum DSM 5476]|uniref:Uncharacterized protein n=1 Tax=[Clostridium] methylpentosum DSM 5476 TaxID=537013 RepID=C0EDN8_9FIRM|nr:hypothetical protein CLOSTMETH_01966 [[Clostridium] methylpentosum DSM 5476]